MAKTKVRHNRVGVGSGLGELEADIMSVVWRLGSATVKDVFEELYFENRLAYTTIMTVMSRLANKGILKQDKRSTAFVYTPNVSKEDVASSIINNVIEKVLDGNLTTALTLLLQNSDIEKGEIEGIQQVIRDKKKR